MIERVTAIVFHLTKWCNPCGGHGILEVLNISGDMRVGPCPNCNGTGRVKRR